jgi:hypothetical protein
MAKWKRQVCLRRKCSVQQVGHVQLQVVMDPLTQCICSNSTCKAILPPIQLYKWKVCKKHRVASKKYAAAAWKKPKHLKGLRDSYTRNLMRVLRQIMILSFVLRYIVLGRRISHPVSHPVAHQCQKKRSQGSVRCQIVHTVMTMSWTYLSWIYQDQRRPARSVKRHVLNLYVCC